MRNEVQINNIIMLLTLYTYNLKYSKYTVKVHKHETITLNDVQTIKMITKPENQS